MCPLQTVKVLRRGGRPSHPISVVFFCLGADVRPARQTVLAVTTWRRSEPRSRRPRSVVKRVRRSMGLLA